MRPGIRSGLTAALLLLAALFVARNLMTREEGMREARADIDRDSRGYLLYQRLGCRRCHGGDLQGTHKAPALRELSLHYDISGLVRYLDNPDSAQLADPRLSRLDQSYPKHEMPSYPLRIEAAETLANFLLAPSSGDSTNVNAKQNLRQ